MRWVEVVHDLEISLPADLTRANNHFQWCYLPVFAEFRSKASSMLFLAFSTTFCPFIRRCYHIYIITFDTTLVLIL